MTKGENIWYTRLHTSAVPITWVLVILHSLSVRRMYREHIHLMVNYSLSLYLSGRSLSSRNKGKVTFINSLLYFLSRKRSFNSFSFLARAWMSWLAFWINPPKWSTCISVVSMQREQLGNMLPASKPWASYVNLWFKGSRAAASEDWAQPQFKPLLTEAGFGAVLQEKIKNNKKRSDQSYFQHECYSHASGYSLILTQPCWQLLSYSL